MPEPLDPAVEARLARLADRGRVVKPARPAAASPRPSPSVPVEAAVPPPPPPPAGAVAPPVRRVSAPSPTAPPVSRVLPPPPAIPPVRPARRPGAPSPAARRRHPAEGSRLVVGVVSVATALGLVAGLAFGSRQPATAQPSANPPVVVVPDPSSGSTTTRSTPAPTPVLPTPSTNSGGS